MDCATIDLILSIYGILLYTFCASLILWLTYQYFKTKSILCHNPYLYYTSFVFFILIFLTYFFWATSWIFRCIDLYIEEQIATVGSATYVSQYYLLVWILFYRMCGVFKGTIFAVSNCTKRMFYTWYFLGAPMMGISVWFRHSNIRFNFWPAVLYSCGFALLLSTVLLLIVSFIRKLITISKNPQTSSDLLPIATKTFILSMASIASLCFMAFIMTLNLVVGYTTYVAFLRPFCSATDVISNFLSIFLNFKPFEKYYMKICGKCHTKCIHCCTQMFVEINEIQLASVIAHSNSSQQEDGNQQ
eukprot:339337_1